MDWPYIQQVRHWTEVWPGEPSSLVTRLCRSPEPAAPHPSSRIRQEMVSSSSPDRSLIRNVRHLRRGDIPQNTAASRNRGLSSSGHHRAFGLMDFLRTSPQPSRLFDLVSSIHGSRGEQCGDEDLVSMPIICRSRREPTTGRTRRPPSGTAEHPTFPPGRRGCEAPVLRSRSALRSDSGNIRCPPEAA